MMKALLAAFLLALFPALSGTAAARELPDTAFIIRIEGTVSRLTAQGEEAVESFTRLKRGDRLAFASDAWAKIFYLGNGRQETWRGAGRLEVDASESRASGLAAPELRQLSPGVVRQIARTPSTDAAASPQPAGRTRAIGSFGGTAQVEATYRRLRLEAARGDLDPELYLLSGLFELREFDRIEQVVAELRKSRPNDPQVGMIVALYKKAIRNAREASAQ